MVAVARSERGCGSWPATAPAPAAEPSDCTVANVSGEPPPKTYDVAPICAPAPSWTTSASEPAAVTVPFAGSSQDAPLRELPEGERPPRMRSRFPTVTSASRESGAASCQGSMPASSDGGPAAVVRPRYVPAPVVPGAAAEPDAADVVAGAAVVEAGAVDDV